MIENNIIDVSTLNFYIKNIFEADLNLQRIYIKGEISNLKKHYTGHYYFSLKDENSMISCMMFSSYVNKLKYPIQNGDSVLLFGKVSVYDKLGTYQIYAYNIEPYGLGKYLLQLEELKKKLASEGLFDKPKKKINLYPSKIAIVTSKNGAAIQDLIHTINSRWSCEIEIYPCLVQGEEASKSIVNKLKQADLSDCDTIILARGGGANEDLKAFNDEILVRTCYALNKPLITAIGHQIDTSIVDYVSDYACITPTEAGEKCCVKSEDLRNNLINLMELAKKRMENYINNQINSLMQLNYLIDKYSPINKLNNYRTQVEKINDHLDYLIKYKLLNYTHLINSMIEKINSLNPRLKLKNGNILMYKGNKKITTIDDVSLNDHLNLFINKGQIIVQVKEIIKDEK